MTIECLRLHGAYRQIADYIEASDLPRKSAKRDGLLRCQHRRIPMQLVQSDQGSPLFLLDGVSIDPSELETGHWL